MVGKSMSWRYHSIPPWSLQTWNKVIIFAPKLKKFNFHWWRHNVLRSIEVISLTGDRFSPKFWYVIAENSSFSWRHHSGNFRLKATMHNLSYLRVMSMGDHFFSKHESTWQCSLSRISVVIAPFSPKFLVCCTWDYERSVMWSPFFN